MLYIDRRKEILSLIMKNGSAKVSELAKKYAIGEATIRRDLKYLAENYRIQLTYGGAFTMNEYDPAKEYNIEIKKQQFIKEKQEIARKSAALINDGDTIALNSGSTVELIFDYLENITHLNIITLSLNIAVKASMISYVDLYIPGGKLRSYSGAFYGRESEEFLKKFSIDKAFFGVLAVNLKDGVTHSSFEEINSNRVLFDISRKKYLAADSSKFDKMSFVKMANLKEFDGLIVDGSIDSKYIKFAEVNGIKIF